MGIWTFLLLMGIVSSENLNLGSDQDKSCFFEKSPLDGKQFTCRNVSSSFFETFNITLDRSHWLKCENCSLGSIKNTTFYFTKNNISYLTLANNKITSIGDRSFAKFPLLKLLNLAMNYITDLRPDSFLEIRRLLKLDLNKNYIKILPEGVFKDLGNLDILNLNDNNIYFIDTNAFLGLMNLKYLYMNQNKLLRLEPGVFKHLDNLKILYLESNLIKEIHPLAFNGLHNLNLLYMNNNSINYFVQYNFKPLTSLVDLQLRYNNLTEIQTSTFNGLKNLRSLYLGRNNLSFVHPYGLIGLNNLENLEMIGNKFEYFSLDYFRDMENLRYVWLEGNRMKNFTIPVKSDVQSSLSILDLSGNSLRSINFRLMHEKMPKLESIRIGRNPWQCQIAVNMYNYFSNYNVSVCAKDLTCNSNETQHFLEEICEAFSFDNQTENESNSTEYPNEDNVGSTNLHPVYLMFTLLVVSLIYV